MRKLLNDRGIRALRPTAAQFTVWDTLVPAFGIRVSPGGRKSFVVMKRPAGKSRPVRITLAPPRPKLNLQAARALAEATVRRLAEARDADSSARAPAP